MFYKQHIFFNSASVFLNLFINWTSNIGWVLLNIYQHHHTGALFTFNICEPMSRHRSIYVVSTYLFFFFTLIIINHNNNNNNNNIISLRQTHRHTFFPHFLEYRILYKERPGTYKIFFELNGDANWRGALLREGRL